MFYYATILYPDVLLCSLVC
uniref:Uncharacterized protein n=1 Tax=Arundo donax TaxID=35708 RepID=A0A0A9A0Q5_ARUDO